jgi:hypothetical protein
MPTPKAGYKIDGVKVPGVTTVIGRFKESGALIGWAYKQGRQHGGLAAQGLPAPASLYEVVDDAANIGTIVHARVDDDIHSRPYTLEGADERVHLAFGAYMKWKAETKALIVATEMPLISLKHRFGGTPDAIASVDGQLCLLDWKTSKYVYTDHLIQLAAYRALWNEVHHAEPLTGGSHLLRFDKETGNFDHHYYDNLDEAWEQFLLFRRAYDLDKDLVARMKKP